MFHHELNVWLHGDDAGGEHGPAVCTPCNWKEFNLPCATPSLCVKANRQNGEIAEIFWQLMSWRLWKWSRVVGECRRRSQSGVHGAGGGLFWANSRYKCTFFFLTIMGLNEWSGFGRLAISNHARTQTGANTPVRLQNVLSRCSDTSYFLHAGKSRVMPIRRAAATPTQEKAPSAAAEKG